MEKYLDVTVKVEDEDCAKIVSDIVAMIDGEDYNTLYDFRNALEDVLESYAQRFTIQTKIFITNLGKKTIYVL